MTATRSATAVAASGSRARASSRFQSACTNAAASASRSAESGIAAERNLSRDVPIRAVIFDFNGTLSHDEPVLCRIYRELFAEYGKAITDRDYYERLSGLAEHTIAEICLGLGDPRIPGLHPRTDRPLPKHGR